MRNTAWVLILFITSCGQNKPHDAQIKNDIIDITKHYNKVWETLNVDSIAQFHSDKSFIYYWHGDLASGSNDQFRKLFSSILSDTKEWSMKTLQPVVQVINENAAIISFTFQAESTVTSGTKSTETGALTYIWNKIKDKWKLVHIHESAK